MVFVATTPTSAIRRAFYPWTCSMHSKYAANTHPLVAGVKLKFPRDSCPKVVTVPTVCVFVFVKAPTWIKITWAPVFDSHVKLTPSN